MNKIKSLFITLFPTFAMIASGYGIYNIYLQINQPLQGNSIIWLGAVIINLPIVLFIGRIMLFKDMARTTAHFPLLSVLTLIGLAIAIYGFVFYDINQANAIAFTCAIIGIICFFLYNFWYSALKREPNEKLAVGEKLPAFSLLDTDGTLVESTDFSGSPSILLFFRGNWCPLCMAQIQEVADQYRELAALGAKVMLISPQPEKNTQSLAAAFNVPFQFYTDKDNQAAKILGIEMKNGLPAGMEILGYDKDTVLPTVLITDENLTIIYSDLTNNYRIRPEPDAFLDALKQRTSTAQQNHESLPA